MAGGRAPPRPARTRGHGDPRPAVLGEHLDAIQRAGLVFGFIGLVLVAVG